MEHFKSLTEESHAEEMQNVAFERAIEQTARIQKLFKGTDGELGLKEIDCLTGYKNDTFHPDPYQNAYNAGKRAVSIILRNLIERDVKEARKHMIERKEK